MTGVPYNIQGVDQLIFSITASSDDVLANTDYGIEADGGTSPIGIRYNVPTGKEHIFYVNGTSEMEIGTVIDVKSNKIINLSAPTLDTDGATKKYVDDNAGGISNPVNAHLSLGGYQLQRVTALYLDGSGDNDHSIDGQTTGIAYNVDSVNDYHIFNIDEVEKFRIDIPHIVCRETLSMDDNSIQDVSQIYMNSSGTNDSWINPHSTGISFQVATGDQFNFQINSVTKCTIDSGSVTHSNFIVTESIFFSDSDDPEFAGEISRNGSDMLAMSDGIVKNLTCISGYVSNTDNTPSDGTLDGWFGSVNGCIGVQYYSTSAQHRLWARSNGTWKLMANTS